MVILLKEYEQYAQIRTVKDVPVILRVDGRSFSKYTKQLKLNKPFDKRLRDIFINVSKDLINEFNPKYVYTFSDEINILFEQPPFNRRMEKINSVIPSFITASFMKHLYLKQHEFDIDICSLKPTSFDSRIIQTASHTREYFKWRQDEAWRNCINSYAQHLLNKTHTPKETSEILYQMKKTDLHELLYENNINIAHVPTWQKRGVLIHKIVEETEGINPKTNEKNISKRKKINVNLEMKLIN